MSHIRALLVPLQRSTSIPPPCWRVSSSAQPPPRADPDPRSPSARVNSVWTRTKLNHSAAGTCSLVTGLHGLGMTAFQHESGIYAEVDVVCESASGPSVCLLFNSYQVAVESSTC